MTQTGSHKARSRLRVFEAVEAPGATTKFVDQVVRYAPSDVDFVFFSWPRALLLRYDVFHTHWPEHLLRDRTVFRRIVREILFRLLVVRLRWRGTPVIRTVHNLTPHEQGSRREIRLLELMDSLVTVRVVLNECTPHVGESVLIRHGDYRESLAGHARGEVVPGRMVFFGRIEPYKRVPELIAAVRGTDRPDISLRVVGRPTPEAAREVERELDAIPTHAMVSADLRLLTDAEMVHELSQAEVVVLPYREMHNSGVALVALSLGRPVAVPRNCVTQALADEVGPGWVHFLDGELSAESIEDLMSRVRQHPPEGEPTLETRDWRHVAGSYADIFRRAASSRRSEPAEGRR